MKNEMGVEEEQLCMEHMVVRLMERKHVCCRWMFRFALVGGVGRQRVQVFVAINSNHPLTLFILSQEKFAVGKLGPSRVFRARSSSVYLLFASNPHPCHIFLSLEIIDHVLVLLLITIDIKVEFVIWTMIIIIFLSLNRRRGEPGAKERQVHRKGCAPGQAR
jgi:hypothetical protein